MGLDLYDHVTRLVVHSESLDRQIETVWLDMGDTIGRDTQTYFEPTKICRK